MNEDKRHHPGQGDDFLSRRLEHLEESQRMTLDALNMAAQLGNFQPVGVGTGSYRDRSQSLLMDTMHRLRQLIRFREAALYIVDEELHFDPALCDPPESRGFLEAVFEDLVTDRTIAWALQRRTLTHARLDDGTDVIVHPMMCAGKVSGMFLGLVGEDVRRIFDTSFAILSIILQNSATALENLRLQRQTERSGEQLADKVLELEREIARRGQAESRLNNAREFLNRTLDTIPEPVFISGRSGMLLTVNESMARFFNMSRIDMPEMNIADVFPAELEASFRKVHEDVYRNGGEQTAEWIMDIPSCGQRYVSVKFAFAGHPETGEATVLGILSDLTEHKRAEEQLAREGRDLLALLEGLPAFVYVQDRNGVISYCNRSFRELFGDCVGSHCFNIFQGPERQCRCEACTTQRVFDTGLDSCVDKHYVPGRIHMVHEQCFTDRNGEVCVLVLGLDVTDQRRAVQVIQENERRYRDIFENIQDVYFELDADLRITEISPSIAKYLNVRREDVLGADSRKIIGSKGYAALLEDLGRDGEVRGREVRLQLSRGQSRHFALSAELRCDSDGCIIKMIGSLHDIDARRKTEMALREAKRAAEAASEAKSEFLANMSHEIRTPLNGTLGMLQLLGETPLSEEQAAFVETAQESGRSLLTVINDILDLSKIEAGRFEAQENRFEVRRLVSSVIRTFEHQATTSGVALTLTVDSGVPEVLVGDNGRLRQILFNLVGNAMKFTHRGQVHVELVTLPECRRDRARILFVVRDTGIGIPDDKISMAFEAFTQVDGSNTRRYQGTGLGLGIVRRLVHQLGGTLTISSEVDRGTEILFRLDYTIPHRMRKSDRADEFPAREGMRGSVLVVEDNRVNRIMACRSLQGAGFHTEVAENGLDALTAMREKGPFDCVLMDMQMPVMDGREAVGRIRAGEAGEDGLDVPIVAITAHAMQGDRESFINLGMNAYLPKPFEMEDLRRLVRRMVLKRRR